MQLYQDQTVELLKPRKKQRSDKQLVKHCGLRVNGGIKALHPIYQFSYSITERQKSSV